MTQREGLEGLRCCGCGAICDGLHKPCDCPTRCASRKGETSAVVTYRDAAVARYVEMHGEPVTMTEALARLARATLSEGAGKGEGESSRMALTTRQRIASRP